MDTGRVSVLVVTLAACCAMPLVASSEDTAGQPGRAEIAAADSASDLGPTSSVPWNPPRAIPAHEPWEEALNAPFTLLSLPFRALGAVTEVGLLHVQQESLVPRVQLLLATVPSFGLGVRPASLGDRTGFGVAVDFAPPWFGGFLRTGLDASMAKYSRTRVELGPRWLFASYGYDWRPQQPFYGTGPDSREGDASNYAAQSQRVELRAQVRAGTRVRTELGAWVGERSTVLRRGRDDVRPSFESSFPQDAVGTLNDQQDQLVVGARAALDNRKGHPHWSHGSRLASQVEHFDRMSTTQLAVFPGGGVSRDFTRYSFEGQTGWSFMRDPRTLRLTARVVDVAPSDPARPPTLLDLSRLGGGAGLAGFEPGRFHDLDLFVARLGYIFPIAQYAEMEIATELGAVSGDVWNETRLDGLEHSYTVMLRPRTEVAPLGAIGVSWSREGVRIGFSLGGVE